MKNKLKPSISKYTKYPNQKQRSFKVVKPTKEELKIFERGRREVKRGDFVSWEELKKELSL